MKKTKLFIEIISLCLALACMAQPAFATASTVNTQLLQTSEILDAVAPLIKAESVYYNINSISVTATVSSVNDDGTVDTSCNIVMDMCLKAQTVDELPYVAGMLSEMDVKSVDECYAAADKLSCSTITDLDYQNTLLAAQVASELNVIADNIGTDMSLTFAVVINTDANGTINQVLGCGDVDNNGALITFPLNEYFPDDASTMFEQGANAVSDMRQNLSTTGAETMATNPTYYRVKARDYAKKYSSEASTSKVCPHGRTRIDTSYYNKAYLYYCHVDCANYVSQAIYAGGIPTDSQWYPGSYAWINVDGLRDYFYLDKAYWYKSTYENCNAGNIIINVDSTGDRYHVNMCVLNDTVNRAYAAHNADHSNKAYSRTYWSDTVEFYKFYNTNPA